MTRVEAIDKYVEFLRKCDLVPKGFNPYNATWAARDKAGIGHWDAIVDVGKVLSGTSQQYVPAEFRVVPEVKQAEWYQLDRDIADAEG